LIKTPTKPLGVLKLKKAGKGRLNPTQRHERAKEKVLRGFVRGLEKLRN